MSGKLEGKVALITGGSSGIGLASARRFVEEGAHVFISGRRESELAKAVAAIGRKVSALQGDVASLEDIDRMVSAIRQARGVLDILVANAGFVEHQTIHAATPEHFDKTFGINARGTYFTVSRSLPIMREGGSIVLVSSCLHLKGLVAHGAYSATKAALRSFARTWAAELKDRKIRVNSLSPGATDTPIIDAQFRSRDEADAARVTMGQITPLGRMARADEMAAAALFLASSDSSFSTGIDLVADGGFSQI